MTTSPAPIEAMIEEISASFGPSGFLQDLGFRNRPVIEAHGDRAWLHFTFRTTSGEFLGERSDIHDLIPLTIAAILRGKQSCSFNVVDEPHPVIPELGEIYSRYLIPTQPLGPLFSLEDRDSLEDLLEAATRAEKAVWEAFEPAVASFRFQEASAWTDEVRRASRQAAEDPLSYQREGPSWDYFHSPRSQLTVARCRPLAQLIRRAAANLPEGELLQVEDGLFFSDGPLQNFVPAPVAARAKRLIRHLERQLQLEVSAPALVPLENRLLVAGELHLASIPADCSRFAFARARERVTRRRQAEARLLYGATTFRWADGIPPERFEDLVRELLHASGDVSWIRSAGPANERDAGRDLVADWWRPAARGIDPEGDSPFSSVKVVVQCKARAKTVGKADVRDVRDTLERHGAGGYFLAVSTRVSNDLVEYLNRLRTKTGGFVDWWTRAEIEDELRRNPEIAERYSDVVASTDALE